MNSIFGAITKLFDILNKLFDSIDARTLQSIRNGFFTLVFLLMVAGAIVGYNMGTDSARVKSPPLVDSTNDIFDIDISRSKNEGSFSEMLDTEDIREGERRPSERTAYPAQEQMEPETEDGIFDSPKIIEKKRRPSISVEDPVIEGEYTAKQYQKGDVRDVRKNARASDTSPELITGDEKGAMEGISGKTETETQPGQDIRDGKKGIRSTKRREPQPITDDTGIIRN